MMLKRKRGAFLRHPVAILGWARRQADHWSSNRAERRVARAWYSRPKRLMLSGVLALGTLGGFTVAAPLAYAGSPQITALGGPGEIMVTGRGFTPGATVRLEALTPGLNVLRKLYVTADSGGNISEFPSAGPSGEYAYLDRLGPYVGDAFVAADGAPGPTAWAKTHVYTAPTFYAVFFACLSPPGNVVIGGYNFQPGDTVRLELLSADSSWALQSVMDYEMATVDSSGHLLIPRELNVTPGYSGHAMVFADEYFPGGLTIGYRLDYVC